MVNIVLKGRNHLSFDPMQKLYNLINEKVLDINSVRRAQATQSGRQWIYPSTPEANDENYPRVSLINDNVRFEEYGSGQFYGYEKTAQVVKHMVFAKVAIMPLSITVFCKRNQKHAVSYYDGASHTIQNTKQSDFLGEKIAKFVEFYRSQYFIPYNMDIRVNSISRSYDDNDYLIAKTIECEIILMDEWEIDLSDPTSDVGNILNINTTINVTQVE